MKLRIRLKTDDFMICILLLMQLGFHTNTGYDDYVSMAVSFVVFLYFLMTKANLAVFNFTKNARNYIVWYTLVVLFSCISVMWAEKSNLPQVRQLIINTYIPVVFSVFSVSEYLRKGNDGLRLLEMMIAAEVLVSIRALMNTPFNELLSKFNTRLYGTNLGVNYNHFTTQFALVFCVVLFLLYNVSRMYYIPGLFLLANIIISGSRKVLFVSVIAFVLLYIISSSRTKLKSRLIRVLIVVVVLGVMMWVVFNNEFLNNLLGRKIIAGFSSMFNLDLASDDSEDVRRELLIVAGDVFRSHPVAGVGYYSFLFYNRFALYAHNNYMEVLADLGIIGFILYYSYYFIQIVSYFKMNSKKPKERFKIRIGTDFSRSKWNHLGFVFMFTLMLMEYGQVTFFRPYVLIPLLVVTMAIENMKNSEEMKRRLDNVLQ